MKGNERFREYVCLLLRRFGKKLQVSKSNLAVAFQFTLLAGLAQALLGLSKAYRFSFLFFLDVPCVTGVAAQF